MAVPIVVVAFNRARSLARLLASLNNAVYEEDNVPLIISIDKGDNQDVLKTAENFEWKHGQKTVVYQSENLKLRKHILKCGDYSLEYGSVIILEDDLFVSKYFYDYTVKALAFSEKDDRIGGISLYNHRFNVEAAEPFEYHDDEYDNWYFQFASSWGEAWTQKQWTSFKEWYDQSPQIKDRPEVPKYVRGWSDSSWLKYFISYLIEKDKYFIYPKKSLTTNFGEAGTHVNKNNTNHQVPLQDGKIDYHFSSVDTSGAVYDAFFENVNLSQKLMAEGYKAAIDLYGQKPLEIIKTPYLLTRNAYPRRIIKSYGCCMRPHDDNVLFEVSGDEFFLYDMTVAGKAPKTDPVRKVQYNLRYIDKKQYSKVIRLFIGKTANGIKRRIKR